MPLKLSEKMWMILPYYTNQFMKGFVHIHWRILGTGFNISYLKKEKKKRKKKNMGLHTHYLVPVCSNYGFVHGWCGLRWERFLFNVSMNISYVAIILTNKMTNSEKNCDLKSNNRERVCVAKFVYYHKRSRSVSSACPGYTAYTLFSHTITFAFQRFYDFTYWSSLTWGVSSGQGWNLSGNDAFCRLQ